MFVVPHVDRARMVERIAEAMQSAGVDVAALAKKAKIAPELIADVSRGVVHDDALAAIGKALGRDDLAPLINMSDPDRRDRLPPEGREVPETEFWLRRLRDGDVRIAPEPAAEATPQPAAEPAASQV